VHKVSYKSIKRYEGKIMKNKNIFSDRGQWHGHCQGMRRGRRGLGNA